MNKILYNSGVLIMLKYLDLLKQILMPIKKKSLDVIGNSTQFL
jgi:hypothetical protein